MAATGPKLPPFSSLTSLQPFLHEAIESYGFERMTPVQASSIPLFLQNKDVVVEAVTGSGKTLAYALPVIHKLSQQASELRDREVGAIVILPTRELAQQVHQVFSDLLAAQPSTSTTPVIPPPLLLTGGNRSTAQDINAFLETNSKILIGTPGRLEEFLLGSSSLSSSNQPSGTTAQRKTRVVASVKALDMLVLDEADRLLDLGFAPSLTRLISSLPKQRRTGLFSATMNDAISDIVRLGLRNPVRVVVKVEAKSGVLRTPTTLTNQYMVCKPEQKTHALVRLLKYLHEDDNLSTMKFIVYFSTGAAVDYFYKLLSALDDLDAFSIHSLHGHQAASRRQAVYKAFTGLPANEPGILLCTDVAARGLDIPSVDCVIQYDPPTDPKTFSHRCGRTARAGQSGRAVLLLLEGREEEYVDFLKIRKTPLRRLRLPDDADQTESGKEVESLLPKLRGIVLQDRDLEEKGAKAFVSFVQSYSKHEASFIFRLADLNLPRLGESYGLLRLPKMPELKGVDRGDWTDAEVDWDAYAYADPSREAARQKALLEEKPKKPEGPIKRSRPPRSEAWSEQKKAKQAKLDRQTRRQQGVTIAAVKRSEQPHQGDDEGEEEGEKEKGEGVDAQELEEWREDERAMKKARKHAPSGHSAVQGMFDADAF